MNTQVVIDANALHVAIETARAEGIQEGRAQGRQEERNKRTITMTPEQARQMAYLVRTGQVGGEFWIGVEPVGQHGEPLPREDLTRLYLNYIGEDGQQCQHVLHADWKPAEVSMSVEVVRLEYEVKTLVGVSAPGLPAPFRRGHFEIDRESGNPYLPLFGARASAESVVRMLADLFGNLY